MMGRIPVAPGAIEKELIKVWREAAVHDQSSSGVQDTRVRMVLSNLVVLLLKREQAAAPVLEDLITSVTVAHPSRIFVLEVIADGTESLQAAVSSRCVTARSGAHVCSEEIYLTLPSTQAGAARNLLLSLLAPDVSTVVMLYGDLAGCAASPESSPAAAQICALADRIVYDGLLFTDYPESIESLLRVEAFGSLDEGARSSYGALQEPGELKLRDLNWRRMQRWRSLVAEQFDSARVAAAGAEIRSLVIRSKVSKEELLAGRLPAGALLLAGWAAAKLDWLEQPWTAAVREDGIKLESASGATIVLESSDASEAQGLLENRSVVALSFLVADVEGPAALNIRRSPAGSWAEISMASADCDELYLRKAPFAGEPLVQLALEELVSSELPLDFRTALEASMQLTRALKADRHGADG